MGIASKARQVCEDFLREDIRYNTENEVAPSESAVAERLLTAGDALEAFYAEIYPALDHDGITWKHVLGSVLSISAYWSKERLEGYRAGRKELEELNQKIARQAQDLADMLDRRNELHNHSAFSGETYCHVVDVIDEASKYNGHYRSFMKERLNALGTQFDLKYWPSLSGFIQVIGEDAARAKITASDPLTEAATRSSRPSKADFLRALLAALDENRGDWHGAIPRTFELSNAVLADLLNVLLELPRDDLVGEDYVKTQRHRYKAAVAVLKD